MEGKCGFGCFRWKSSVRNNYAASMERTFFDWKHFESHDNKSIFLLHVLSTIAVMGKLKYEKLPLTVDEKEEKDYEKMQILIA